MQMKADMAALDAAFNGDEKNMNYWFTSLMLLAVRNFIRDSRPNTPIEEWDVEKIIHTIKSAEIKI